MASVRHLNHPPILEALIDFQFSGSKLDRDGLETFANNYLRDGWTKQELSKYEATLGLEEGEALGTMALRSSSYTFDGYAVVDSEEHHFIQLRTDRLTVSNVRHYSSWEDLEQRASRAFGEFVAQSQPLAVTRIAARYINRIPPNELFTQYESILERAPLPLPGEGLEGARITDFLRRHVVEGLDGGYTANLTVGTVNPEAGEHTKYTKGVVLDIDVFKPCELQPNFEAVRVELARIRTIKNALFFGSLKETAMEQFL